MNAMSYPLVQHCVQRIRPTGGGGAVRCSSSGYWCVLLPWLLLLLQSLVLLLLLQDIQNNCGGGGGTPRPSTSCPNCSTTPAEPDFRQLVMDTHLEPRVPGEESMAVASRVFYNRVPKCGSSTMIDLITMMHQLHNFTFIPSGVYMRFFLQEPYRKRYADAVLSYQPPVIFERHFHFLNFNDYGYEQPSYFNLVRDPLERLVSWYYFRRFQAGHIRDMTTAKRYRTYDECVLANLSECVAPGGDEPEEGYFKLIPFFCGQDAYCREPSERAIVQAIFNVKQYYAVVGVMEEYSQFIDVLEYVLPSYFRGAPKIFDVLSQKWKKRHKTTYKLPISDKVRQIMTEKLNLEYQFYTFLKLRIKQVHTAMAATTRRP